MTVILKSGWGAGGLKIFQSLGCTPDIKSESLGWGVCINMSFHLNPLWDSSIQQSMRAHVQTVSAPLQAQGMRFSLATCPVLCGLEAGLTTLAVLYRSHPEHQPTGQFDSRVAITISDSSWQICLLSHSSSKSLPSPQREVPSFQLK